MAAGVARQSFPCPSWETVVGSLTAGLSTVASIKCAHCKNTHTSVQEVRECSQTGVLQARWNLYWLAWDDMHKGQKRPQDEDTAHRQEDFENWLERVSVEYTWFIAPGVTDEDRRKAHLAVRPAGTLQSRMEEMRRAMEGPLFCGHFDKAGDLCEAPLELTAENDPTHEDRLINLEHDPVPVSHGQLERLRAGKSLDGKQLQSTQERRKQRVDPVTEGYYKVGDTIYKVQRAVHGSQNLYAKELVLYNIPFADSEFEKLPDFMKDGRTVHHGKWEYARGAIRRIRSEHKLSIEECLQFGKLYGVCVRCARTLTKEESIARGMGDVCAGKGLVI